MNDLDVIFTIVPWLLIIGFILNYFTKKKKEDNNMRYKHHGGPVTDEMKDLLKQMIAKSGDKQDMLVNDILEVMGEARMSKEGFRAANDRLKELAKDYA